MKALIISQFFQPEPIFKGMPLATALRERGFQVEVLTAYPNYPGGKIYPGWKVKLRRVDHDSGVRIVRVPIYPDHGKGFFRRAANYLSFFFAMLLIGVWSVSRPDVIYVYNLPTCAVVAYFIRLFSGAKVLLDVQDMWPESIVHSGFARPGVLARIARYLCSLVYRSADRIVVLSHGFKRVLVERGVKSERIEVIYNWCDEISLGAKANSIASDFAARVQGRFGIVNAGNIGILQDCDTVVEAARICKSEGLPFVFVLVGDGPEKARIEREAHDLETLVTLERRPYTKIREVLDFADVVQFSLRDEEIFQSTIPSRLQAYLYVGRPILCGVGGEASEIVSSHSLGAVYQSGDARSLVEAAKLMYALGPEGRDRIGRRCEVFYRESMSFEIGAGKIGSTLLGMATR